MAKHLYWPCATVETQQHDGTWLARDIDFCGTVATKRETAPLEKYLPDSEEYLACRPGRYDKLTGHTPGRQIITRTFWRRVW